MDGSWETRAADAPFVEAIRAVARERTRPEPVTG